MKLCCPFILPDKIALNPFISNNYDTIKEHSKLIPGNRFFQNSL
jgi:hypothetical protein